MKDSSPHGARTLSAGAARIANPVVLFRFSTNSRRDSPDGVFRAAGAGGAASFAPQPPTPPPDISNGLLPAQGEVRGTVHRRRGGWRNRGILSPSTALLALRSCAVGWLLGMGCERA